MSESLPPTSSANDPVGQKLDWIQLELTPLPDAPYPAMTAYWNPDTEEVVGEAASLILQLANQAQQSGSISSPNLSHIEIESPLSRPSELAAVLAQYFWVVPLPVTEPALVVVESSGTLQ